MITAAEARKLAGPTVKERVEDLDSVIRELAREKKREVHLHDTFWVNEGYSKTKEYKEACKLLTDLGYKVEFFYEERQFVNMFTIVSW